MIHELKTVNPFFEKVLYGDKGFEVRIDDREYKVGDMLNLKEYIPEKDKLTGRRCLRKITYILTHEDFPEGIKKGYVVMSIRG